MRKVTINQGPLAVEFTRQPREGRLTGKVSVIMYDHEIPNDDVEAMRKLFQENWKATVHKFNLEVTI